MRTPVSLLEAEILALQTRVNELENPTVNRPFRILTTDNVGGNITDVSTASSVTFQGEEVGHIIYMACEASHSRDGLKHWGSKVTMTDRKVDGTVVAEYWDDGLAAWTGFSFMCVNASTQAVYNGDIFNRAGTVEEIRYGLTPDTDWVTKDVGGFNNLWVRFRVTVQITTLPTFTIVSSDSRVDGDLFYGLDRFQEHVVLSGSGDTGALDGSSTIGSGSGEETYTAVGLKNRLNTVNSRVTPRFVFPYGIDTSLPMEVELYLEFQGTQPITSNPELTISLSPLESTGVKVADPTGGVDPIDRTEVNTKTLTADASDVTVLVCDINTDNKSHHYDACECPIGDYYEDDLAYVQIKMTDRGTPLQTITVHDNSLAVWKWRSGRRIERG